jgi:ABC-type uncharacterized transport system substrate-binding protein
VNRSAEQYGLPTANVTGMIEVVPVEQALAEVLRAFPRAKKLLVVSEDSTSERSNPRLLGAKYRALGFEPSYALMSDFVAWKRESNTAQHDTDVTYVPTNGAIAGWNKDEAAGWVRERIRKPVFTCDDFMVPYAAFGLTKVAREQGEWAPAAAVKILRGLKPSEIPAAENTQVRCFLNAGNAARIGYMPDAALGCAEFKSSR